MAIIHYYATPTKNPVQLLWEDYGYKAMAKYILENYEIVSAWVSSHHQKLPNSLKLCRVILLGESHSEDLDRFLNGVVAGFFCQQKSVVLVHEGIKDFQLKYIAPELGLTRLSWDWATAPFTYPITTAYQVAKAENASLFEECQKLLAIDDFPLFAESLLTSSFASLADECYGALDEWKEALLDHLISRFTQQIEASDKIEEELNCWREKHFIETVAEQLAEGRTVITFSGGAHNWKISRMTDYLARNQIPHLSLISKTTHPKLEKVMEKTSFRLEMKETRHRLAQLLQLRAERDLANAPAS